MIKKTPVKNSTVSRSSGTSTKKPRAAIYIRVSTEEQAREGYSLGAQESALTDYVSMMGYDLYKVYRDEGKSAKDIKHRPALQQLLKDAEKKQFKAIFVYKLDRFSRSLKDLILTIEMLKNQNIDFISLQDKIETASASGKLMFHIISSFAEFERDIISERTRFGMTEKAKEGGIISKAALGYKIIEGKLYTDPETIEKVKKLYSEYLTTTKSLNTLAKEYSLSVMGLIKVLQNRTYIGEIKFKEAYQGIHEPIIDKELFEKVQLKLDANSYEREYLRNKNLIQALAPQLDVGYLDRIAFEISKGNIILEKIGLSEVEPPTTEEIEDIPGTNKLQKYYATRQLLDEGYLDEDISYDRVFVNADKTDIYADNSERHIYIDCTTENIQKLLEYLEEGIEYRIILGTTIEEIRYYGFRKGE